MHQFWKKGGTKIQCIAVKLLNGNDKVGFVATTTMNRKQFDINWNKTLDKGGLALSEEVKVRNEGQRTKQKPASTAAAGK